MGSKAKALELFHRGWECQQGGDLQGAVRLYQASIAEEPTAEAHTFLGWVYSFEGRYEEAIAECKRAIAEAPRYQSPQFPHMNLARIHEERGDLLYAVKEFSGGGA